MAKKQSRTKPIHRHAFRTRLRNGKVMTHWARIIRSKKDVFLVLKPEHVRESIKRRGVGDTQNCTASVCFEDSTALFPHHAIGINDFFYSRAFIASKEKEGIPIECYEYEHSVGDIAKMNDTIGGQKKLLAQLEAGGDRIIHLRPVRHQVWDDKYRPKGKRDGSRTKVWKRGSGLRMAVASAGSVEALKAKMASD